MHITQSLSNWRQRYSQSSNQALRNPWVLGWIGLVIVFLAVNALFFILAVASNPGLVVDNYYEQGRRYEKNTLKLLAAREALRWETKLDVPRDVRVGDSATYRFSMVDVRGVPIDNADVRVVAYRPSSAAADFETPFVQVGAGIYQASMRLPLPGVWDLNVKVQHGADRYEATQRIHVQQP